MTDHQADPLDDLLRDAVRRRADAAGATIPEFDTVLDRHRRRVRYTGATAAAVVALVATGIGAVAIAARAGEPATSGPVGTTSATAAGVACETTTTTDTTATETTTDTPTVTTVVVEPGDVAGPASTPENAEEITEHVTQADDYPLKVAEQYCMSLAELADLNGWGSINELPFPGVIIFVYDRSCAPIDATP